MNLLYVHFLVLVGFIEYVLFGKILLGCTNFFSPNEYKKNDKVIYRYFKDEHGRRSMF